MTFPNGIHCMDLAPTKLKTETQDTDAISAEPNTNEKDKISINIDEGTVLPERTNKKELRDATIKGNWSKAEAILQKEKDLAKLAINGDGSTVLHMAVGMGHNDFVKNLLSCINVDQEVLEIKRDSDGSTALHIAAVVGNKYAADLLVKMNKKLLRIEDHKGEEPLHKAYENMHLDIIGYLLKASDDDGESKLRTFSIGESIHHHTHLGVEIGVNLLVNTISAKRYSKWPSESISLLLTMLE
uniref:putative ankyrin repeat protein RBE_0317 n=1 Tax=Erigeron canadensis TaxID=72917 RepID=UPI001CB991FD|nr:putative ankyrin repeat protein RBE_0317 [Erigeron canadensis]